jgi:hypothetical protein
MAGNKENSKFQKPKIQTNSNTQTSNLKPFEFWDLRFWICLEFGFLEFGIYFLLFHFPPVYRQRISRLDGKGCNRFIGYALTAETFVFNKEASV